MQVGQVLYCLPESLIRFQLCLEQLGNMTVTIYIICLGVGLFFTLLSAFFGHVFGGGHEGHVAGSGGHVEAGADSSDMPGVSILSPTIIASFITAFGGL